MGKNKKHLHSNSSNCLVYLISFIVSGILIILGLIMRQCCKDFAEICLYIGTSGIGAVALAFFIELSNNKIHDKKIQEFRKNQLCGLLSNLKFLLNRTAWYFVRCFSILDKNYSTTQFYVLNYQDLWEKFGELNKKYNDLLSNEMLNEKSYNEISTINKNIVSYYKSTINTLSIINSSIVFFESQGYFNHEEVLSLQLAENLLNSIFDDGTMIYDDFNQVFENIIEIKEFEGLKNLRIYSYNRHVEYEECINKNPIFARCQQLAVVPIITKGND